MNTTTFDLTTNDSILEPTNNSLNKSWKKDCINHFHSEIASKYYNYTWN